MTIELIKGEGKYVYGKLKMWKERIKTSFLMAKMFHTICIAMQRQC